MLKINFKKLTIRYQVLACMLLPLMGFCYFYWGNAIGHSKKAKGAEDTMVQLEIAGKLVGMASHLQGERQAAFKYLATGSEEDLAALVESQEAGVALDSEFRTDWAEWREYGWDPGFTVLLDTLGDLPIGDVEGQLSSPYQTKDGKPIREQVLAKGTSKGEALDFYSRRVRLAQAFLAKAPAFVRDSGPGRGLEAVSGLVGLLEGASREACHVQAILREGKVSDLPGSQSNDFLEAAYAVKEQEAGEARFQANAVGEMFDKFKGLSGEWNPAIDGIREKLREGADPGEMGMDPSQWDRLASGRQGHYLAMANQVLEELRKRQEKVLGRAKSAFWVDAVILLLFLGSVGTGMWILQRASARITHLTGVAETLAMGDVSPEIQTTGEDDLGQMAEAFRKMILYLKDRAKISTQVSKGNYGMWVELSSDADELGLALKGMVYKLHLESAKQHKREWIQEGQQELSQVIASVSNMEAFSNDVISFLCNYLNAEAGLIYVLEDAQSIDGSSLDESILALCGIYSCTSDSVRRKFVKEGEGLVGECLRNPKIRMLDDVTDDYLPVGSGFGEMPPRYIMVAPIQLGDIVIGVVELAAMNPFSEDTILFWESISEALGTSFLSKQESRRTERLLQQTQHQAAVLQSQQEELQAQTEALTKSKADLEDQKQKLQETNVELENHATELARQKQNLEKAQGELQKQAEELELASKYKSEFLANMSHELRTPLNALLILAQNLSENKAKNLTDKQIKWAKIIHGSGTDLLSIINDILDLSKIEAGMLEVHLEPTKVQDIADNMQAVFEPVATKKGIEFKVDVDPGIPEVVDTDVQRLSQVLRNLIGNAQKFTHKGHVHLNITPVPDGINLSKSGLDPARAVAFSVEDTGVGIPGECQAAIWEAFQQADGSTSRKFGGTGLGLSISRELARMLGGEIQLVSEEGKGSTFTCYMPLRKGDKPQTKKELKKSPTAVSREAVSKPEFSKEAPPTTEPKKPSSLPELPGEKKAKAPPKASPENVGAADEDDPPITPIPPRDHTRDPFSSMEELEAYEKEQEDHLGATWVNPENLVKTDSYALIVEDDTNFAHILYHAAKGHGLKMMQTSMGREAIEQIRKVPPKAVFLDIHLEDMDGWHVLKVIKEDLDMRHIPVLVLSGDKEAGKHAVEKGAVGFLEKPVDMAHFKQMLGKMIRYGQEDSRKLLHIDADPKAAEEVKSLFGEEDISLTHVDSLAKAKTMVDKEIFDCLVMGLNFPDGEGNTFLAELQDRVDQEIPPVIVYTNDAETVKDGHKLNSIASSVIIKGSPSSQERLLDEASLHLHRVVKSMSDQRRETLNQLHESERFDDRTVLLVDDDPRNMLVLSEVLEEKGFEVVEASNGKIAIEQLEANPQVDIVLMDIMMPEMDGYEATKRIRTVRKWRDLPIMALTAKAMSTDRSKCIDAGANDYLTKPIDIPRLFSLIRAWIRPR